ncbi:MAG: phosphopantothenoylcysteine decarboxylase [Planctomycetota bacterium]
MALNNAHNHPGGDAPPRLLITAGPTREPIDAVRFLGNRSSGRLGVALAQAAAAAEWSTTILLGPTEVTPTNPDIERVDFESTAELDAHLQRHLPTCDILIMAAAVSDYRPIVSEQDLAGKHRRGDQGLEIKLEPTNDLLAGCSARRQPGQLLIGFALEPLDRLESSALRKLAKKSIDLIVANPLETMGADKIDAKLFASNDMQAAGLPRVQSPAPDTPKADFARWLLERAADALTHRQALDAAKANH